MLADPVASPMVKPIVTGFAVPARFAFLPSAPNTYLRLPVGKISMVRLVPLMTPEKVNPPARFFLNEPVGMVRGKVPTFSCTGSVAGAIPSLSLPVPSVKLPNVPKAFSSKSITACGLNVANGSVVLTTAIATATGNDPAAKGRTGDRVQGARGAIDGVRRDVVGELIRHIGELARGMIV